MRRGTADALLRDAAAYEQPRPVLLQTLRAAPAPSRSQGAC